MGPRSRIRSGGFRSSRLNALGWLAVLGPGLVAGLVGSLLVGGSVLLLGVLGMAMSWAVALAIDHLAWRRIPFSLGLPPVELDLAEGLIDGLRARGVEAEIQARPGASGDDAGRTWSVRSTNRYRGVVYRAVEGLGRQGLR